jgi:hypothetical protein
MQDRDGKLGLFYVKQIRLLAVEVFLKEKSHKNI